MEASHLLNYLLEGHKHDGKTDSFIKEVEKIYASGLTKEYITTRVAEEARVRIDIDSPQWDALAAKTLLAKQYDDRKNSPIKIESFYDLICKLTDKGVYGSFLLERYSEGEIYELQQEIDVDRRDELLTYVGATMLYDRYQVRDREGHIQELPQERFMIIAMTLMKNEPKDKRLEYVKEAYWALSNLYMTVATPTLSNSGKPDGQLSSCFIDTVDDSLDSIYLDNWDSARVSKHGGGVGVYVGKIRGRNSSIKGYKDKASGIVPWIKQLNNTATSVDQLGQRQGAIAIYTDIWHWDVLEFLQLGTNNGDERLKARDIFTGLCIPDYFMELIEADGEGRMLNPDAPWHMFDPHEVRETMGWSLEDFYDEEEGKGSWREKYEQCVAHPTLRRKTVPVKEIVKAIVVAQIETGTPYMFYRDEANRQNANKHLGMIYCSNLCTEIMQNQTPSGLIEEKIVEVDGKARIRYEREIGDFVVCNLASLNLGRVRGPGLLRRAVRIIMRMLDNVIDVNHLPLLQASHTNLKYRPVGLGTFGWHHALALEGIKWDAPESITFADQLYEELAFYAIEMSMELAKEKGAAPAFEGSEYQTGVYFDRKGYSTATSRFDWDQLKADVMKYGIRNVYWGAVAPNSSTALIAGSTQGIDPFYGAQGMYFEEKKDFKLPVLAPGISPETFEFYYRQNAHYVSQEVSILQNQARQRHIDQAVSFNIYVEKDIKAKDLMQLHRLAWKKKLKTTYYTRSTANQVDECEACQ